MVSQTLASLDAWLALAEEVLAEQEKVPESGPEPTAPVQLSLFGEEL
jgi:hypothetical protein